MPTHVDDNGVLDWTKVWTPTLPNQKIRMSPARFKLRVGGAGSSKSSDATMEIVETLLRYPGAQALIIRRYYGDLTRSNIPLFRALVPKELYTFRVGAPPSATFVNGSKLVFGNLEGMKAADLDKYLSSSYVVILFDECTSIPGEAFIWMSSRNRVNPECNPDDSGKYPRPYMLACCNPIGAHWTWYRAQFRDGKPLDLPKGARRDREGRWWTPQGDSWELYYNPTDWAFIHSTLLDNPHQMRKDPNYLNTLKAMPPAQRDAYLLGTMDSTVGEYFSEFDPLYNVINLRDDPDAVLWEEYQPRWLGWDWGRAHYGACYWFTLARVRLTPRDEYKRRVICYRELVQKGHDYIDWCADIERFTKLGLPNRGSTKRIGADYQACYFSHEKFSKVLEEEGQQVKITRELQARGLNGVTRGTMDRVGRATLMYVMLRRRSLVILDSCEDIISSITSRTRNEKNTEDVLKTDDKYDDCYDGFSMGLFGQLGKRPLPQEEKDRLKLQAAVGLQSKNLTQFKIMAERDEALQRAEERRPAHMEQEVDGRSWYD